MTSKLSVVFGSPAAFGHVPSMQTRMPQHIGRHLLCARVPVQTLMKRANAIDRGNGKLRAMCSVKISATWDSY